MNHIFTLFIVSIMSLLFVTFPTFSNAQHDVPANNSLEHKPAESYTLESITITAEKMDEYVKNHPQNVTILERKEIQERNFLDVGEAINSMPGVDVRQSGSGMGTRISIRGSSGSGSVLVLVNGRPLNSSQYGSIDLSTIPVEVVKSVMVFKPPVPVWLGPGATAGAINIVTYQLDKKADQKKHTIRLKLSAGSYGVVNLDCSDLISYSQGNIMLTGGFGHKDGKRDNSDKNSGNFSFHWDKKNENLMQYDLDGKYFHSEHGSAGPIDNPTPDARQRYDKGSLDFRIKGFMGETGDYSLKSYADMVHLKDTAQSGDTSTLESLKIGLKGDAVWAKDDATWALRAGGLVERETADHTLTGEHHREKISLHTQLDKDFGDMTVSLGLRGDYTNDFDLFPAFSSGLSYAIGEKTLLKANAGYSVKIPTFSQLYQPSHGSMDQVRGNPDLSEEDVWSYDMGIEHQFGKKTVFEATLFRTDNKNLISYNRGDDLIYRPENISRAYRQGIEVSFKYQWLENVSTDLSYILQETENRETGNELIYAPRHKAKITLKYSLLKTDTRFEATLRAASSQYSEMENNEDEKLDAYASADLKIIQPVSFSSLFGSSGGNKKKDSEIFIHFRNLTDSDFEFHYGYPDDGFRFISGINMNF